MDNSGESFPAVNLSSLGNAHLHSGYSKTGFSHGTFPAHPRYFIQDDPKGIELQIT